MLYDIFTDVTSDLTEVLVEQLNIVCIPMPFMVDETDYIHYSNFKMMGFEEFYKRLSDGQKASTTQINTLTYIEYFEKSLSEGRDILYLCFSSGLSSTYQSALIAAEELREKYPLRKIYIVDTLCASAGGALFVYLCCKYRNDGKSIDDVYALAEKEKLSIAHWFTVNDLMHLHRGGRISKTAAIAGSIIGIMPILHVDNDGHLILMDKVRGRHRALQALAQKMFEHGKNLDTQTIFISHGNDLQSAEYLKKYINENTKVKDIIILPIGPIIGAHSGPGTIALFFVANTR